MHRKWGIVLIVVAGLFIASFTPFHADHAAPVKPSRREREIRQKVYSQIVAFRDYVKDSFYKKITFQELSKDGLRNIAKTVTTMAEAEGLQAHSNAVKVRLAKI